MTSESSGTFSVILIKMESKSDVSDVTRAQNSLFIDHNRL